MLLKNKVVVVGFKKVFIGIESPDDESLQECSKGQNRRRELTLNMIRRLHEGLGIPAESLIKIGHHKAA